MNIVFLIGKIVSDIEFNFTLNNKNISISTFEIKLENSSILNLKGYNEIADLCYSKLKKNDIVVILGKLNSNMEVIIDEIHCY